MHVCPWAEVKKSPLVKMAADSRAGWLPGEDRPGPGQRQPGLTLLGHGLSPALPHDLSHTFEEWPVGAKGDVGSQGNASDPATLLRWANRTHGTAARGSAPFIHFWPRVHEQPLGSSPISRLPAQE